MTPEEQSTYRAPLDELIQRLEAQLALADPSDESITPDNAIGRLTRMEAIQAQSMNAAMRRKQEKRLRSARAALRRIEKGAFGDCAKCGEPIPSGRLDIMPDSALCVECARRS